MDHWRLTASAMAAKIRAGALSSEEIVRSCLDRIEAREAEVQAWEWLEPDAALEEARARDSEEPRGPLHGVPVGIKDIIDTADMPTGYGSPIYADHQPEVDADCVAALREAGAVILGKTVTTEFATFRPGKTRNPHQSGHTPGGSSSGSAAAVAAGMVPLALGSQTVGSVIRPASFCGVVGFKATQGCLSLRGVHPLAAELDSLGCFARSVADAALWFSVLSEEPLAALPPAPPKVALVRTAHWDEAEPETQETVEAAARRLAEAGAAVEEPRLPRLFDDLTAAQDILFAAGAVEALRDEWESHRDRLSPQLVEVLERGMKLTDSEVAGARNAATQARAAMQTLLGETDLILAPAAKGEAPEGLSGTGDPLFNRMWTLLLGPCLTLPFGRGPRDLPVGVQLVGHFNKDRACLGAALWAEDALGTSS